ncbi:hypothetical protein AB1Y20_001177 [Prymnesium parvum]|uniref:peptidylprolyl isomerase n=1 Tax=Prymnesium parvum TaxID=97485 RepID=A0AB34IIR7_PRYPA
MDAARESFSSHSHADGDSSSRALQGGASSRHRLGPPSTRASLMNGHPRNVEITLIVGDDASKSPRHAQVVAVHYDAYLPNGEMWDSSKRRGRPLRFQLGAGQVIPGLEAGVEQMCLHQRVRLRIPAALAYGEKGFPACVPPNTGVEFDLELVEISDEPVVAMAKQLGAADTRSSLQSSHNRFQTTRQADSKKKNAICS